MRVGTQEGNFTAIATATDDAITIRGRDLCTELIGKIGFTDYFWFLVTGGMPTATQRLLTDASMVAIAEHGLVPSVQAARMTLAAAPEATQGAVAAGLLGMGSVVAGSSETAGFFLADLVEGTRSGRPAGIVAGERLKELAAARSKVPGLGHPQHRGGDPRADALLALADEQGVSADHVGMLRTVASLAPDIMGRQLPINVSGAIPAIMLDAGFPARAMKGLPILARTAGLIAHLLEETERPIGFIMSHHADLAIEYDGPAPASAGERPGPDR